MRSVIIFLQYIFHGCLFRQITLVSYGTFSIISGTSKYVSYHAL
jgi:hypothetical protein